MTNRLAVVFCFDEMYVMPTLACATSLLKKTPNPILFMFHRSVQNVTLKFLELALKDVNPTVDLRFRSLEGHNWAAEGYGSHLRHTTACTNDRLVVPEILEKYDPDINRVLYLDGDTMVFADLTDFVNAVQLPASGVGARRVGSMRSKVWGHGAAGGNALSRATPALNAGVLVLDLDKLKKNNFSGFCKDVLKTRPCNDQSVLNLYCHGCFARLPAELNLFVSEVGKPGFSNPRVLHCAGQSLKFWAPPGTAGSDRYGSLWRSLLPSKSRHEELVANARVAVAEETTKTNVQEDTATSTTVVSSLEEPVVVDDSVSVTAAPKRKGRKAAVKKA